MLRLYVWSTGLWQKCQNTQQGKDNLFNKKCWENWISTCKHVKVGPHLIPNTEPTKHPLSANLPGSGEHTKIFSLSCKIAYLYICIYILLTILSIDCLLHIFVWYIPILLHGATNIYIYMQKMTNPHVNMIVVG